MNEEIRLRQKDGEEEIVEIDRSGRVKKEGALGHALDVQGKMLDELQEIVTDLGDALATILVPAPPPSDEKEQEVCGTSEKARQVKQHNASIQDIATQAAGLLERLDV